MNYFESGEFGMCGFNCDSQSVVSLGLALMELTSETRQMPIINRDK